MRSLAIYKVINKMCNNKEQLFKIKIVININIQYLILIMIIQLKLKIEIVNKCT